MRIKSKWGWIEVIKEGNKYILRYDGSPEFVEYMRLLTPQEKLKLAKSLETKTIFEIRRMERIMNKSLNRLFNLIERMLEGW
jgi:hypothetical protein